MAKVARARAPALTVRDLAGNLAVVRRADPLRVAEAKLQGALHRLAAVGPHHSEAVAAVEARSMAVAELGGNPDVIRFEVDHVLAERLAKVRGAKFSSLRPRFGFNP